MKAATLITWFLEGVCLAVFWGRSLPTRPLVESAGDEYSAFLAAKVLVLDDLAAVPSMARYDGQNDYPTNEWVLFGHHFAAISGAGPLIGPVLAAQFGFLPGLSPGQP